MRLGPFPAIDRQCCASFDGPRKAINQVARGDLDLAVPASWDGAPVAPPGLTLTRILQDPMVVAFADDHRLAGGSRPLPRSPGVASRDGSAARAQLDRINREAGFEPRISLRDRVLRRRPGTRCRRLRCCTGLTDGTPHRGWVAHRPIRHRAAHRAIHTLRGSGASDLTLTFERLLDAAAAELRQGRDKPGP